MGLNQKNLRKMTQTDKEKIKEVLGILEIKIKDYEEISSITC